MSFAETINNINGLPSKTCSEKDIKIKELTKLYGIYFSSKELEPVLL